MDYGSECYVSILPFCSGVYEKLNSLTIPFYLKWLIIYRFTYSVLLSDWTILKSLTLFAFSYFFEFLEFLENVFEFQEVLENIALSVDEGSVHKDVRPSLKQNTQNSWNLQMMEDIFPQTSECLNFPAAFALLSILTYFPESTPFLLISFNFENWQIPSVRAKAWIYHT